MNELLHRLKKLRNEDTNLMRIFKDEVIDEYFKGRPEGLTSKHFLGFGAAQYSCASLQNAFFCLTHARGRGIEARIKEYMAMLTEALNTRHKALSLNQFYREVMPLSCALVATLHRYGLDGKGSWSNVKEKREEQLVRPIYQFLRAQAIKLSDRDHPERAVDRAPQMWLGVASLLPRTDLDWKDEQDKGSGGSEAESEGEDFLTSVF